MGKGKDHVNFVFYGNEITLIPSPHLSPNCSGVKMSAVQPLHSWQFIKSSVFKSMPAMQRRVIKLVNTLRLMQFNHKAHFASGPCSGNSFYENHVPGSFCMADHVLESPGR